MLTSLSTCGWLSADSKSPLNVADIVIQAPDMPNCVPLLKSFFKGDAGSPAPQVDSLCMQQMAMEAG